jgi:hypothetical protein
MENVLSSENIKKFITGGNATFTIKSNVTGVRFTYKVKCARKYKNDPNKFLFVSVLTGNNNDSDYTYIGMIKNNVFQLTKKSAFSLNAPSVMAFNWFSQHVFCNTLPNTCEVYHEGRCGRCGRTLTVPESVESGFGPECINKI